MTHMRSIEQGNEDVGIQQGNHALSMGFLQQLLDEFNGDDSSARVHHLEPIDEEILIGSLIGSAQRLPHQVRNDFPCGAVTVRRQSFRSRKDIRVNVESRLQVGQCSPSQPKPQDIAQNQRRSRLRGRLARRPPSTILSAMADPEVLPSHSSARVGFIPGFLKGLRGYAQVPAMLTRLGLWHHMLWPALVSFLFSVLFIVGLWFFGQWLTDYARDHINISVPWLDNLVAVSIGILTVLLLAVLFVLGHKHIVLVILAPILGKLAEAVQRRIDTSGRVRPMMSFAGSILRSAAVNSRSLVLELFFTVLCLAFLVVPFLGSLISSVLIFLIQARFMGQGLFDFPLEYRRFTLAESARFARENRGLATGLGSGFLLLMFIPIVGWMFAAPFGTVAGVLEAHKELERREALNGPGPDQPVPSLGSEG